VLLRSSAKLRQTLNHWFLPHALTFRLHEKAVQSLEPDATSHGLAQAKWPSRQGDEQSLLAGCHAAILQQRPPGGLASVHSFESREFRLASIFFRYLQFETIASGSSALDEKY